ncbi:hypothetical protein E3Q18_04450 [Wallemia mellicola]|nr:hypothetical protein E3Q18_04450 [Wallemia mellicola]
MFFGSVFCSGAMTSSLPNDNGVLGSNKEAILSDPGAQLRTNTETSFLGFNSMSPVYQRPDDPEPFRVNTFILFVGMPLAAIVFPLWATMATDFATAAKNKWIHWWLGDQQPIKRDGSPDWTVVSGYDCSQPQTCLLTDSVGDATFGILEDSESSQPSSYLSFDEAGNIKSRKGKISYPDPSGKRDMMYLNYCYETAPGHSDTQLSYDEVYNYVLGCADVSQLDKYADTGVFCGCVMNSLIIGEMNSNNVVLFGSTLIEADLLVCKVEACHILIVKYKYVM